MKKRVSSSLKSRRVKKSAKSARRSSATRRILATTKKTKPKIQIAGIKNIALIQPSPAPSFVSPYPEVRTTLTTVQPPSRKNNLSSGLGQDGKVGELFVKGARVGTMYPRSGEATIDLDKQRRQFLMWSGVTVSMIFIIVGWLWTLRYSFSTPNAKEISTSSTLNQTSESLTELFYDVSSSLDKLQTGPYGNNNSAPLQPPRADSFSEEEIQLLKQKIEKQAAAQQLNAESTDE